MVYKGCHVEQPSKHNVPLEAAGVPTSKITWVNISLRTSEFSAKKSISAVLLCRKIHLSSDLKNKKT